MSRKRNSNNAKEDPSLNQSKSRGRGTQSRRGGSKTNSNSKGIKEEVKSGNDPAWYAANPVILKDAASYPFSYVTGASEIHDPTVWTDSAIYSTPEEQVPGICSLKVYPCVGTASKPTDPINVAAQSVYSFVRHANSGHSNYDSPDLMIYIMAMAYMYAFLVWCQRLYGYALTYDQRNRYLPNDLIRLNNVDPADLVANLANFRFWINSLIAKMVSFAVPATMSIFSRMTFIFSDYYIEGTSIKEQLYQYIPAGFYKFALDSDGAGKLEWTPFDFSTLMTVTDVETYGNNLFNAIWGQEDFGIMSGDILKAYGQNIIKLQQIPELYSIVPKFDPMVLTQMKNADVFRVQPVDIGQLPGSGTIAQVLAPRGFAANTDVWYGSTHPLTSNDVSILNKGVLAKQKDFRVLTVDTDDPTPEVVIEATRLKVAYDSKLVQFNVGTEMIVDVILTQEPGVDYHYDVALNALTNIVHTALPDITSAVQNTLAAMHNFHYAPACWIITLDATNTKICVKEEFDIDNFTVMTFEDVKKLHEAAVINMFAVPSIGKVM